MEKRTDITIYARGLVSCSVCVPDDMDVETIESLVNMQNPTGVDSKWSISEDKMFADGVNTNPCVCQTAKERKHYLLTC